MPLVPLAAALLIGAPAPTAVTPGGAATLRASWLGAKPSILYPPRVLTRWRVTVGEGGAAGPVALRVLSDATGGREGAARGRGPQEQLPATPGTYEFPARLTFLSADTVGLDQATGGHAIVAQHRDTEADRWNDPFELHALDVWRPPLPADATRDYDERTQGQQLLVAYDLERDVDRDGYGDATQDENDLRISARPGRRSVRVRVRNRGSRPVAMPRVQVHMRGARLLNATRRHSRHGGRLYRWVELDPIRPGGSRTMLIRASRPGFRVRLVGASEGFDPTPSSVVVRARSG